MEAPLPETCKHRNVDGKCEYDGLPCVEVCEEYYEPVGGVGP